ncbi:MAG: hypothetical protein ACRD9W_15985, partial [Terriglobia bacterium]
KHESTNYVIELANGHLWANLGASQPAQFGSLKNARQTISGFSGRGALANPKIRQIVRADTPGARFCDGFWVDEKMELPE